MMPNSQPDHYKILAVSPTASQEEIRKQYYQLVKQYHQDVYKGPDAHKRTAELNKAYSVLGDPDIRLMYDALRREQETKRQQEEARRQAENIPPSPGARTGTPPSAPFAKEAAQPKRRRRRRLLIKVSVILVLVVIVGGIAALRLSNGSTKSSSFHQEVVAGPHITGIEVYSESLNGQQVETDTFYVGDIVFVSIGYDSSSNSGQIDLKLFDGKTIQDFGSEVSTGGVVKNPGIDKWVVYYNGTLEASITFQVLS